jgi:hypothetical protein
MTVDFNTTDQPLIKSSASDSGEEKWEYNGKACRPFMRTLRKIMLKLREKNCTTITMNLIFSYN